MNFWKLNNLINENKEPYTSVRWMIRRDLPQVIQLAMSYPDFEGQTEEEIEKTLVETLKKRQSIGMVAETGDVINGFMFYFLNKRYLELPVIVSNNKDIAKQMINKLLIKITGGDIERDYVVVRAHYDLNVLNALKELNINMKTDGDYLVGVYMSPKAKSQKMHKSSWWKKWYEKEGENKPFLPHAKSAPEPEENDPYGLFKNLPWQDKDPGDEEMA